MKVGDTLQEGIVVSTDGTTAMVGRVAGENELVSPAGHSLHIVGGQRVFLSHDQAPIEIKHLHPVRTKRRGK